MSLLLTEKQNSKIVAELVQSFSAIRSNNSAYSLRAFSKKLSISSGALTEILQKKRTMTLATAKKILQNLHFSPEEIETLLSGNKSHTDRSFKDLSFDQYEVLASWHYLSLLNLLELPHVKHDTRSLAHCMNLTAKKIEDSLSRLLRLEMIEKKGSRYLRTFIRYQTSEDISNVAIKKYHQQILDLSHKALLEVPVDERDFSSIVLKFNPKNLKQLKDMIRKFQDEVCENFEEDTPQEIFHLNVQAYPVTNTKRK